MSSLGQLQRSVVENTKTRLRKGRPTEGARRKFFIQIRPVFSKRQAIC